MAFKTKKRLRKQKGGKDVFTNCIDNKGKKHRSKKCKEGKCNFPFLYNKSQTNNCVSSKRGNWCAVTKDKQGKMKDWGYCIGSQKKNTNSPKKIKLVKKKKTAKKPKVDTDKIITYKIEYKKKHYLLDPKSSNVFSMPQSDGTFVFVGKLLPNETIRFSQQIYNDDTGEEKETLPEDDPNEVQMQGGYLPRRKVKKVMLVDSISKDINILKEKSGEISLYLNKRKIC